MTYDAHTLHDFQVLQRDADDKARVTLKNGQTQEFSVGGPYEIGGRKNILVGDLWVLAGQSNMEGCGDLVDVETSSPFVHCYQSRGHWGIAEEPLTWLSESPYRAQQDRWSRPDAPDEIPMRDIGRTKGAGLGLTFAKRRHAENGVPIGLIPTAHGGTSMQQWSPELKSEGGASLYGATLKRFQAVGGRVAGILWYQGESDANPADAALYKGRMAALVKAFRADFGQPDLPFYYIQLGRFTAQADQDMTDGWNGIREAQRTWAGTLPFTDVVTAIDLDLDDGIHIGTPGLKRLGERMARVVSGAPAPRLNTVAREGGVCLRVTFGNVRGGLRAAGRPAGFTIRDGDERELPIIYKITLSGDSAILYTEQLPADTQIWYGWGLDPYCNLTDAEDAGIPAFGSIVLPT